MELYVERLRELGANYVLPFSIRNDKGAHAYYLIHASNDSRAVVAMKDAIRSAMNSREKRLGQQTFGFETSENLGAVATQVCNYFRGQRDVPWTDKGLSITTVQGYAIRETRTLYADMMELKRLLEPNAVSKRPLKFSFP
jgi:hypothetical protein